MSPSGSVLPEALQCKSSLVHAGIGDMLTVGLVGGRFTMVTVASPGGPSAVPLFGVTTHRHTSPDEVREEETVGHTRAGFSTPFLYHW